MKNIIFTFILIVSFFQFCQAQNKRLNDHNTIGWYNYFGTIKLGKKFSLHTEYQWRRDNLVRTWQQSLLRTGINYQIHPKAQLRIGYAWIETFPYGDIPINSLGRDFTEHRLYQMLTLTDKISIVDISHRFLLEQRWVGRYSNVVVVIEDQFPFLHRLRYMVRAQMPLRGRQITDNTPYIAIYDEVMIGFGSNVGENIFDQNRLGILLGYSFSSLFRLEAGFLNQIVQLGREVNNQNVYQYNNGLIVNTMFIF